MLYITRLVVISCAFYRPDAEVTEINRNYTSNHTNEVIKNL